MSPFDWIIVVLFVVNLARILRARDLGRKGLCQRCGRRPSTTTQADLFQTIAVCGSCSQALSKPLPFQRPREIAKDPRVTTPGRRASTTDGEAQPRASSPPGSSTS